MTIKTNYDIGEIVYLVTDESPKPRMVNGYVYRSNIVYYYLTSGVEETMHCEHEFSREKTTLHLM